MKISILAVAISTSTLFGCANMGYVINTYGGMDHSEIEHEGYTYRIFDRKDLSKVMITPSLGQSIRGGAIKGATFGGVNIQDDKGRFTGVAIDYLNKENPAKLCEVKSGEMILDPQWEFIYLCNEKTKQN